MKKLLIIALLFSALQSFGQVDTYTFTPYTTERFRSSDSIQVGFQLSTNNAATANITSVVQTGGPTVKFVTTPVWVSGQTVNLTFWLQGLAPGTYSFTATGKSGSGTTGTQTKTFTVVADPVCPPVTQRSVTSVSIVVGGVTVTIPASGLKFAYDNGTTQ